MDRTAVLQRVGSVGVAQPVGADLFFNPYPLSRRRDDAVHVARCQVPPRLTGKDRVVGSSPASKGLQLRPQLRSQQDGPRPGALAEKVDLTAALPDLQVLPLHPAQLRDPAARLVEEAQQQPIPLLGLPLNQPQDVRLWQNPLGQRLSRGGHLERLGRIERQVAHLLGEGEQGLHRVQPPPHRPGGVALPEHRLRERRYVLHPHLPQRLVFGEGLKESQVSPVGIPRVRRLADQPQLDQCRIALAIGQPRCQCLSISCRHSGGFRNRKVRSRSPYCRIITLIGSRRGKAEKAEGSPS